MAAFDVSHSVKKKQRWKKCSIIKDKIKRVLIWENNWDINQTKFTHAKPFDMKENDGCSKFVRNEKPVIGFGCNSALFSI